uniref:Uncharacterized protein n=1 Tax=Lotharella globosa TaxID=91324 RepID=A0A7S3YXN6_9EUKA
MGDACSRFDATLGSISHDTPRKCPAPTDDFEKMVIEMESEAEESKLFAANRLLESRLKEMEKENDVLLRKLEILNQRLFEAHGLFPILSPVRETSFLTMEEGRPPSSLKRKKQRRRRKSSKQITNKKILTKLFAQLRTPSVTFFKKMKNALLIPT